MFPNCNFRIFHLNKYTLLAYDRKNGFGPSLNSCPALLFFVLLCLSCLSFLPYIIWCVCFLLTRAQFLEFQWNRKFDRSILKARDLFLPPIFFLASFLNSHRLIVMDFFYKYLELEHSWKEKKKRNNWNITRIWRSAEPFVGSLWMCWLQFDEHI